MLKQVGGHWVVGCSSLHLRSETSTAPRHDVYMLHDVWIEAFDIKQNQEHIYIIYGDRVWQWVFERIVLVLAQMYDN